MFFGDGMAIGGMIFIPIFLKFEELRARRRAEFGTMFDIAV
jgi:hypothetical protein